MGYSNDASVGNRLRSLKKRYGFVNLEGRTAAAAAKAAGGNEDASAKGVKTESDRASVPPKKKGRPARAKSTDHNGNGTVGGTTNSTTNGTTDDATNGISNGISNGTSNGTTNGATNGTKKGEKKSSKRKRDDENDEDPPAEQELARPAKKARGRRKAAASIEIDETRNGLNTEANTEANDKAKEVIEMNDGPKEVIEVNDNENKMIEVNDKDNIQPGKSVRFASLPNSSKPRNEQGNRKSATPSPTVAPPLDMEELTETVSGMGNPADRMFFLALETIKEARRERRMRQETPKTGLKLRFRNTAE